MRLRLLLLTLLAAGLLTACDTRSTNPTRTPGTVSIQGTITWDDEDALKISTGIYLVEMGSNTRIAGAAAAPPDYTYEFKDIPAGDYAITAHDAGHGAHLTNVTVTPGKTTTVNLPFTPLGTYRGRAVLEGLPGQSGGIIIRVLNTPFQSFTDFMGEYRLIQQTLPEGTYTLTLSKDGYETVTLSDVIIRPGEETVLPDVVLRPTGASDTP